MACSTSLSTAAGRRSARQRFDVQALVRLQELERLQGEACPIGRRARAARAEDAAQWRDPAEAIRPPPACDRIRRSGPPRAGRPARRPDASRTSAPHGPNSSPRPAARRRGGAARTAPRLRGAPRGSGPPARPGTRPWPPTRASRAGAARRGSTCTCVTTSNVRPRARATRSSASGSSEPPSRLFVRRTPLAIALSLPWAGVKRVMIRSASP